MNLAEQYCKDQSIHYLRNLYLSQNVTLYWFKDKSFAVKSVGILSVIDREVALGLLATHPLIDEEDNILRPILNIMQIWLKYDTEAGLYMVDKSRECKDMKLLNDGDVRYLFSDGSSFIFNRNTLKLFHE